MNLPDLDDIKRRRRQDVQSTIHQQDGAETAELFGEPKRTSMYARIFKQFKQDRAKLLECRVWVLKKDATNKGALFMSQYKKFLRGGVYKSKFDKQV